MKHLRWTALLLCMVMLLSVGSVTAFAYERINTSAGTSLTAHFTENGTGIQGAAFRLYRVANVSDAVVFDLTGDFAGSAVNLDDIESASTWADMAVTLSAYASANGISPVASDTTSEDGSVSFSGLSVGLYLLVGDTAVVGDYAYAPAPTMIMLPTLQSDDTWSYHPSADVKYTKTFIEEYQDLTVKKVWKDGGYDKRPKSVTIQLLRDNEVQDTVTLNAENGWTYTWEHLTSTYEGENCEKKVYAYTVHETNVADGYTVSVRQNDTTYTVTNSRKVTPDDKLPQTGTLNWPIPVLTILGLVLVCAGWALYGRKKEA